MHRVSVPERGFVALIAFAAIAMSTVFVVAHLFQSPSGDSWL